MQYEYILSMRIFSFVHDTRMFNWTTKKKEISTLKAN